jgi:hypothetical protein
METRTNHIGSESQDEEEPKQDPQGQDQEKVQEKDQGPSQEQQDEERFQLLVADLFDSYHPGSPLEDAALVRLARALWKRSQDPDDKSTNCALDQEIDAALAQLSNSQAVRRGHELGRPGTGSMSSIPRRKPDWGLVRRSVGPQMQAHPRCPKEAVQLWAPRGIGNSVSGPKTPAEDPLAASLLAWERQANGEQV